MTKVRLITELVRDGGYTFIFIPSSSLGTRKRVKVTGTINGHAFRTSAQAWRNDQHVITVNSAVRARMGLSGGEQVKLELEPDTASESSTSIPDDLAAALQNSAGAEEAFESLPVTQRNRHIARIVDAKRPETRARRIEETVAGLVSDEAGAVR